MIRKNDWVYIAHMIEMSKKAIQMMRGVDRTSYLKNEILKFAVTRAIEVIGEAAIHVPEKIQEKYPDIPWREIIGMRHRIVHDYLNVDEDVIWEVVKTDLPKLLISLKKINPEDFA